MKKNIIFLLGLAVLTLISCNKELTEQTPNPVADKLNIDIDFLAEDHILIDLYDNTGKLVKKLIKDDINSVGLKKYTFDFPFPSGTYFIDFHNNTGRQSAKIIKK